MLKRIESWVGYAIVRTVAVGAVVAIVAYALAHYTEFDPIELKKTV